MLRSWMTAVVAALIVVPSAHALDTSDKACVTRAETSLDAMVRGDQTAAVKDYNAALLAKHGAAYTGQVWAKLQHALGDYKSHAEPQWLDAAGHRYLLTRVEFANKPYVAINSCDSEGKLSFAEWAPASEAGEKIANAKPRVLDHGIREVPLVVASPFGPLPGTLTLPAGHGPFPAALLIAGSGPQDEDETLGSNKPFQDLAEGLAAAGVASLRYDKRTYAYRIRAALNPNLTVDDEVTTDALTALSLLRKQPDIDARRVVVIGHSLGAMMAPRIGQRDGHVAGLVMLAAPARPLLDVLTQQVKEQGQRAGATQEQIAANEKAISDEKALLKSSDSSHPPQGSFSGVPQSYWLSLRDYDQVAVAKSLSVPLLIVQGAADFQVSPSIDYTDWQHALSGRHNAAFHLYPGLSHLFMPAGSTGTVKDYATPGHVDAQVMHDVATWIKAQPAR